MDLKLKNKKVVVVGGSRGIGLSIVKNFLKYGSILHVISRNSDQELENNLKSSYKDKVFFYKSDATNFDDLSKCSDKISLCCDSSIDILINNVGNGSMPNNIINDKNDWKKSWDVNFNSSINSFRVFQNLISNGSIIFISSITGLEFINAPTDYSVAKSSLISFSKILSHKIAPKIRVNVVCPGNIFIENGSWDNKMKKNPNHVKKILEKKVPLGRFGKPEEISDLVLFLSSYRASFITGSCLVIDGGQTVSF